MRSVNKKCVRIKHIIQYTLFKQDAQPCFVKAATNRGVTRVETFSQTYFQKARVLGVSQCSAFMMTVNRVVGQEGTRVHILARESPTPQQANYVAEITSACLVFVVLREHTILTTARTRLLVATVLGLVILNITTYTRISPAGVRSSRRRRIRPIVEMNEACCGHSQRERKIRG